MVIKELLVIREHKVQQVIKVLLVIKVPLVIREHKVRQVIKEQQENKVL